VTRGVSVAVPVYNSAATLEQLVAEIDAALGASVPYEVILVDDGSTDDTWTVIEDLATRHPQVRGLRLAVNGGGQCATYCGIQAATYDKIVTLDDDLQHPPAAIPTMLAALVDGVEVVYALPDRDRHHVARRLAARIVKPIVEHVFGVRNVMRASSFRLLRAELRDRLPQTPGPVVSIDGSLAHATRAVATVPVVHRPRAHGRSNYTPTKLVGYPMAVIASGSRSPLLFATVSGAICLIAGALGAIAVAVAMAVGASLGPAPWLLAAFGAVVAGLILLALGILGELAARVLLRTGGSPAYVVQERTGPQDAPRLPAASGTSERA